MSVLRKLALASSITTLCLAAAGLAAWYVIQHRISSNEHAPHLIRLDETAQDFPFQTLDGQPKHLADFKGKVVFVDLWGTWCIQCVAEMPAVQKLYNSFRNDPQVAFLIVSRLDSPAAVRRYAHLHRYDLPFYIMQDSDVPASMQLHQFPATFLYAPDGTLAAKHLGAADWGAPSVITFIDALKRETATSRSSR